MKTPCFIYSYLLLAVPMLGSLITIEPIIAQSIKTNAKAQINSWSAINFSNPVHSQLGARFIPEINLKYVDHKNENRSNSKNNFPEMKFSQLENFDVQLSINTTGNLNFEKFKSHGTYERFKPYRGWLRLSGSHFEVRLGLQKINFGSATLLRPLMWFDRIDPRDPLQITDGVYALLSRYYFQNNANIWLWGLYGNPNTKGWEILPSVKDEPEYGGRFQFPVLSGEAGLSFHHRRADFSDLFPNWYHSYKSVLKENKFGLDGKWDVGPGIWFEYVFKENNSSYLPSGFYQYEQALNVGADYTFLWGNGLHVMTEQFFLAQADKVFQHEENASISSVSLNYPIGLIDRISTIVYYSWEDESWYRFVNYERTYDNWRFYLMGFWNPKNFAIYNVGESQNIFAGRGLQMMAVYNF